MSYLEITSQMPGCGVRDYHQNLSSLQAHMSTGDGVFRALAIMWLRAKKDNTDFWATSSSPAEPMLLDLHRLQGTVDLQEEYRATTTGHYVPDSATSRELAKSSIDYRQVDVTASAQHGFAQQSPVDEPARIAKQVLQSTSRFFLLSIAGNNGGHSIAIHSPNKVNGKSDHFCLFDPNAGEFLVQGQSNAAQLLCQLDAIAYRRNNIDLNRSYVLWSYSALTNTENAVPWIPRSTLPCQASSLSQNQRTIFSQTTSFSAASSQP